MNIPETMLDMEEDIKQIKIAISVLLECRADLARGMEVMTSNQSLLYEYMTGQQQPDKKPKDQPTRICKMFIVPPQGEDN